MSTLFVRTLREDPADAELPSHTWLVRAGYIRRAAPGGYTWLPLGLRVMQRIEAIVREEMASIGAQEVRFPGLLPREPYEATGRWTEYGDNLFRLVDRKGADMLLGPTHEEMFTLQVKDMCSSYKDLPLSLFQIQTKFRDEVRPRAGLLRGREFTMKDSYSFDIDAEHQHESYMAHRDAYVRIFDRLGLEYVVVAATSGAMGGSDSEEFLAVAVNGEDTFVRSPGGYAANVEAVRVAATEPTDPAAHPASVVHDTPRAETIETLVDVANTLFPREDRDWKASDTLKNVAFMVSHPSGERYPLIIGVPGDRDVDAKRLEAALEPAVAAPFEAADFETHPQLVRGYIGPQILGEDSGSAVRYVVDPRVAEGTTWLTGANSDGQHAVNVVCGRDFTPDGVLDVADIREGDPAPDGSGPLQLARGIEVGHIFKLGTKYSEALGLKVLDSNGKLQTVVMGSYGMGVSRAVAAVAEATCDDKGLCWPRSVAPFDVTIVVAGKGEEMLSAAEKLAEELSSAGLDVLVDDRKASPGVKFADAELLGVPTSVVVGRGLADGVLELRDRREGNSSNVEVTEAAAAVLKQVRA